MTEILQPWQLLFAILPGWVCCSSNFLRVRLFTTELHLTAPKPRHRKLISRILCHLVRNPEMNGA